MLRQGESVLPAVDERKEIARLLRDLAPAKRLAWLKWCCDQVSTPAARTGVVRRDGSADAVFWDAMTLFWGSGLTMQRAGQRLVEIVRGRA